MLNVTMYLIYSEKKTFLFYFRNVLHFVLRDAIATSVKCRNHNKTQVTFVIHMLSIKKYNKISTIVTNYCIITI